MTNKNKGFTLVELIIVIAILAIIMLIAIPNFSGIRQRMQVRADTASAAQIGKAIRIWYTDKYATENQSVVPKLKAADGSIKIIPYTALNGIDAHVSTELVADSLLVDSDDANAGAKYSGGGKYYVTLLYSGISPKFLIGIDYAPRDGEDVAPNLLRPAGEVTESQITYNGEGPGWVYLEK